VTTTDLAHRGGQRVAPSDEGGATRVGNLLETIVILPEIGQHPVVGDDHAGIVIDVEAFLADLVGPLLDDLLDA